ncbi:ferritin-like domain-containing protein [Ginsengibacter hankyongi]|uniref:Ferritin-like domain-containing protein n=1 Tax=Ginsengibacter hankyongi TaxID=2607284 RepID=A0A5J5IJH3_9BACT|nr:ferritin-like domain-containing protein [Ginsengibacter hankyongi]KAA9038515.1 ferritin-like domain-containing protein [Ginsengibacter hankyongi]
MKSTTKSTQNGKANNTKQGSKAAPDNSNAEQGFRDLFEDELKDIYWAEKALTKAIPKMIKNTTTEELATALEDHLEVTKGQVARLEEVFQILGKAARGKKCEAMDGLIKEAEEIMEDTPEGIVRDAGIISAGQKVEHYEIATYGTLCAFAKTLGEDEVANLLQQTLDEEKEADEKLTEVAEASVNLEAASK